MTLQDVFVVAAVGCFIADGIGVSTPLKLFSLGCACLVIALLIV